MFLVLTGRFWSQPQNSLQRKKSSLRWQAGGPMNAGLTPMSRERDRKRSLNGLNDSPTGLAAWILEKFREWSDCDGDVYRRFTPDELLANVTLYWMTETIHSSFRLYFAGRKAPLQFAEREFVHAPTAIAHFPKELPFLPRACTNRGITFRHWPEMLAAGHFAAAEDPALLAEDLR